MLTALLPRKTNGVEGHENKETERRFRRTSYSRCILGEAAFIL
jgi:hypothetical protein